MSLEHLLLSWYPSKNPESIRVMKTLEIVASSLGSGPPVVVPSTPFYEALGQLGQDEPASG